MAEELLSNRQFEVLHLVAHGLTLAEIAVRLGLAESTVKSHLDVVFTKLDVHDRAAAVHKAHRLRILT
jgi:DNA-binding NarL/FixJ family response regulator